MIFAPNFPQQWQAYKDVQQNILQSYNINSQLYPQQIFSIALDIKLVDPLVVLAKIAQADQISIYWEHKSQEYALAAFDYVTKLEIEGQERFVQAEAFIQETLSKTTCISSTDVFTLPQFFCSFSFFAEYKQDNYPFPAATVFLPRWQVITKNQRCALVMNTVISDEACIPKILQALNKQIDLIESLSDVDLTTDDTFLNHQYINNINIIKQSSNFKHSVSSTLEHIRAKTLHKVVLADVLDVQSSSSFNLFHSLNNLRQIHPNCYVFSLSNAQGQNFIGASPERLISIYKRQLITDALAGSAPRGKTPQEDANNADSLVNSVKEKHEHRLVIDFITERLSQLGLSPQVLAPRLRKLSNIQHLWTPINAVVPTNIHPLKIVAQLHPTPAVAGAARNIACEEIRRYESFERGLYAAPLGWVDGEGNSEFIVGIRSALIDGDRARLYAGAGIVAGSNPEKEFAEVQLKLQALLKALV